MEADVGSGGRRQVTHGGADENDEGFTTEDDIDANPASRRHAHHRGSRPSRRPHDPPSHQRRGSRSSEGTWSSSAEEDSGGDGEDGGGRHGARRRHKDRRDSSGGRRSRRDGRPPRPINVFSGMALPMHPEGGMGGIFPDIYDPSLGMPLGGAGFSCVNGFWPSPMGMLGGGGGFCSPGLPLLGSDMNTMLAQQQQQQFMQFMHMQQQLQMQQQQQVGGSLMGMPSLMGTTGSGPLGGGGVDMGDALRSRPGSAVPSNPALGMPLPMITGWPSPEPTYPHLGMMGLPGMLHGMGGGMQFPHPQLVASGVRHQDLHAGMSFAPNAITGVPAGLQLKEQRSDPRAQDQDLKGTEGKGGLARSSDNGLPLSEPGHPPLSDGQQQIAPNLVLQELIAAAACSSALAMQQREELLKGGGEEKDLLESKICASQGGGHVMGDALVSVRPSWGGKKDEKRSLAISNNLDALAAAAEAIGGV